VVRSVALTNAGAGIASGYSGRFAAFLAESEMPTLVYEYRGIGWSRPRILRGFQASVDECGSKDCAAGLERLRDRYPEAKRTVVGHSVGGFVTGFVTNGALIDRMLLVGAHTGYLRDYVANARSLMFLLWHVLMPFVTNVLGYFPGRRLRLLEDLPSGVAHEWAARRKPEFWWHLRRIDGSIDSASVEGLLARISAVHAYALARRFIYDPFATETAANRLLGLHSNTSSVRLVFSTADGDGRRIGHFGFFRSRFRASLWPRVLRAMDALV
jgi:predicted alpha/beta hydrolase